jgi:hypothetical protein
VLIARLTASLDLRIRQRRYAAWFDQVSTVEAPLPTKRTPIRIRMVVKSVSKVSIGSRSGGHEEFYCDGSLFRERGYTAFEVHCVL